MLLQGGLVIVLAVHLLAVDFASAGPFVALWLFWKSRRQDDREWAAIGRSMLVWSLAAIALGILSGAVALTAQWYSRTGFVEAAGRLPISRYWFGGVELVFYIGCLAAALAVSRAEDRIRGRRFWAASALLVLGGLDLVYHFPPLFVGIGALVSRPDDWAGQVRFVQLLVDPQVASLVIHFILAATASGGVGLMLLARAGEGGSAETIVRSGGWLTLAATLAQLPVGVLVLINLPSLERDALLAADPAAGLLFALAMVASLGLLQRAASIGLGETEPRAVRTAAVLFALVVLLMVLAQQRAMNLADPVARSGPVTSMLFCRNR